MYQENFSCEIQNVLCRHRGYSGFHKRSDYEKQGSMSKHLSSFAKEYHKVYCSFQRKEKWFWIYVSIHYPLRSWILWGLLPFEREVLASNFKQKIIELIKWLWEIKMLHIWIFSIFGFCNIASFRCSNLC